MFNGIIAGNFDIIHPGYIYMFRDAKKYCNHLTVALQTDPTIDRPHTITPILSFEDREMTLRSIKYIDDVIGYTTEEDLNNILKTERYNVRILGDDYKGRFATGQQYSEKIIYLDRAHGWSTTKFKKEIAKSLGENK